MSRPTTCLFCQIVSGVAPAHVVLNRGAVVAFLDIRPVFLGHVLVVPRAHCATLVDLPTSMLPELFGEVQRISAAVERVLGAGGTFVAINNRVSQSVPHLHVHVVPRTKGDGLRGFFWPRVRYPSDDAAAETAARLAEALDEPSEQDPHG